MSDPFIGEIRMFAGNYAPRDWAFCNGQLLPISSNSALFSLLGTIYGGDGRTNFGLPGMRGRIPIHSGTGPGLSPRRIGDHGGSETETLTTNQIPIHNHTLRSSNVMGSHASPANANWANSTEPHYHSGNATLDATMNPAMLENTGGSNSHDNMMPFGTMNFIIALQGLYPSRS